MKTLDRYILRLFLTNLVILFAVAVGLIVLLDLITNFDEFVQAAQRLGGSGIGRAWSLVVIAFDFYGPMVFLLYVYMVGLLPIGAAGFTFATLIRNRELVAMMAGGVSLHRVAMPVLVIGFVANVAMIADQEFILPAMASKLGRSRAEIKVGEIRSTPIRMMRDGNGALFTAASFDPKNQMMTNVAVLIREDLGSGRFGRATERISATQALWDAERHGWQFVDGYAIQRNVDADAATSLTARPRREVEFLASDLSPIAIMLNKRAAFRSLLSLRQLSQLIRNSGAIDIAEMQRIRHSRFSMVVVNMLILIMGTPFFLLRAPSNMLAQSVKAAVTCVGAWAGGFVMMQIAPGSMPPALVAWMPVVFYLPMAVYMMDTVET